MNPWEHQSAADEAVAEIHKHALPRDPSGDSARWQRFLSGLGNFYRLYIRGWTWQQIDRLREAKLNEIESGNLERTAAAVQKLAAAKKLDAQAEKVYYEIEQQRATAGPSSASPGRRKPTEQQWDELRAAIEIIRLKGGSVHFPGLESDDLDSLPPFSPHEDVTG